ncbi:MAG TPA: thiamine-phosphate kinase [Caulobacterales bacterium]|nr:thiamine-phosphate kinase [Caulobacterales bacterium]
MSADEFEIIARYFAPLAKSPAARGLRDDVALVDGAGGLVLTTDALVEGVHFFPDDPMDLVAKKALRVNFSDLAAKGAKPVGFLLVLIWPDHRPASEIADFAKGLEQDAAFYDAPLLGGDTTSTAGPLTIAVTALGAPLGARTPARADAQPGDDVWVTGDIGDAWLGLLARRGQLEMEADAIATAVQRYRLPEPPLAFARIIAEHANASMDVSDGLLADARKLAEASKCAIDINAAPLSDVARAWLGASGDRLLELISGGDDYEILFTAAADRRDAIEAGGRETGVRVTRVGSTSEGEGLRLRDSSGRLIELPPRAGFRHTLGR